MSQSSLNSITRTRTFLIANPFPQYIIKIKNNKISFYNNLPKTSLEPYSHLIKNWIVDSTTILLEDSDILKIDKTINEIKVAKLEGTKRSKPQNGVEEVQVGSFFLDDFTIEFPTQMVKFCAGQNKDEYLSESANHVRKLLEELENKYKPKK